MEETNTTDEMTLLSVPDIWTRDTIVYHGPETRSLLISGIVDEELSNAFHSQLLALRDENPQEPIVVFINTAGGSVSEALLMFDAMRMCPAPIITIAMGKAQSAGLLLCQAGDLRLSYEHTLFFYHAIVATGLESISRATSLDSHSNYVALAEEVDRLIRDRAKMTKKIWDSVFHDRISVTFNAQDALKYKLIDKIMPIGKKNLPKGVFDGF